jgi:hypothetical protein
MGAVTVYLVPGRGTVVRSVSRCRRVQCLFVLDPFFRNIGQFESRLVLCDADLHRVGELTDAIGTEMGQQGPGFESMSPA